MGKLTIKDVAKKAGVSCATVSKALSGSPEISEATRERVIRLSAEMGYTPNALARSMIIKRTNTIGLVVPSLQNPYMSEFTSHAEIRAREAGYNLMVCNSSYDKETERKVLTLLTGKQVDGLIIIPIGTESAEELKPVTDSLPTVFIGENLQDPNQNTVSIDNKAGTKIGTRYLYSLGHRRILYLGYRKNSMTHQLRLSGYLEACIEYGMEPMLLNSNFPRSSRQAGYMIAKHLFEKPLACTAIFCASDALAIGVMQAADKAGLRIPEDFSLMGFDNISFTELPRIDLTTIDQPQKDIAGTAVDMLIAKIDGRSFAEGRRILAPKLVERSSCRMVDDPEDVTGTTL